MMTVKEYSITVDKTEKFIINLCQKNSINVNNGNDVLSEDNIDTLNGLLENVSSGGEDAEKSSGGGQGDLDIDEQSLVAAPSGLEALCSQLDSLASSISSIPRLDLSTAGLLDEAAAMVRGHIGDVRGIINKINDVRRRIEAWNPLAAVLFNLYEGDYYNEDGTLNTDAIQDALKGLKDSNGFKDNLLGYANNYNEEHSAYLTEIDNIFDTSKNQDYMKNGKIDYHLVKLALEEKGLTDKYGILNIISDSNKLIDAFNNGDFTLENGKLDEEKIKKFKEEHNITKDIYGIEERASEHNGLMDSSSEYRDYYFLNEAAREYGYSDVSEMVSKINELGDMQLETKGKLEEQLLSEGVATNTLDVIMLKKSNMDITASGWKQISESTVVAYSYEQDGQLHRVTSVKDIPKGVKYKELTFATVAPGVTSVISDYLSKNNSANWNEIYAACDLNEKSLSDVTEYKKLQQQFKDLNTQKNGLVANYEYMKLDASESAYNYNYVSAADFAKNCVDMDAEKTNSVINTIINDQVNRVGVSSFDLSSTAAFLPVNSYVYIDENQYQNAIKASLTGNNNVFAIDNKLAIRDGGQIIYLTTEDFSSNSMMSNVALWSKEFTSLEKNCFLYEWNTVGENAAIDYIYNISDVVDARWVYNKTIEDQTFANDNWLGASAISLLTNPIDGLNTLSYSTTQMVGGEKIYSSQVYSSGDTMRAQVSSNCPDEVTRFLYNGTMSVLDNQVALMYGGPFGAVSSALVLGVSSFDNSLNDALSRGMTDQQAYGYAWAMAGVEAATEYLSLDNMLKLGSFGSAKLKLSDAKSFFDNSLLKVNDLDIFGNAVDDIFQNKIFKTIANMENSFGKKLSSAGANILYGILNQGSEEAGEEIASSLLGNLVDSKIAGDKSAFNLAIKNYQDMGYTEQEAHNLAYNDQVNEIIMSGLSGLYSGSLTGGVKTGVSTLLASNTKIDFDANIAAANYDRAINIILNQTGVKLDKRKTGAMNVLDALMENEKIDIDTYNELSKVIENYKDVSDKTELSNNDYVDMNQMQMILSEQGIDVSGKSFDELKSIFDNIYNQSDDKVTESMINDLFVMSQMRERISDLGVDTTEMTFEQMKEEYADIYKEIIDGATEVREVVKEIVKKSLEVIAKNTETDEKIDTELMNQMQMMLFEQGIDVIGKNFNEIKSIFDNLYNQTNENVDFVKVIDNFKDLMDYNSDKTDNNSEISYKAEDEVYTFDKIHVKELVEKYKDKDLNDSSVKEQFVGDLKAISNVKITEDLNKEVVEEGISKKDGVQSESIKEEISDTEGVKEDSKIVNAAAAGLVGAGTLASGNNMNSGSETTGSTSESDMTGIESINKDGTDKNNNVNNDTENSDDSTNKSIFDRLKQSLFHGKYGNVNHNIESALNIVFSSKSSSGDISFNDEYKVDFIIKFNDFVFNLNSLLEEKIKNSVKVNSFIDNVCNLVYRNHELFDNIFKNKIDINVDGKKISQFISDLKNSYSNINLKDLNLGKNKVSEKIKKVIESVRTLLDISDKFYDVEDVITKNNIDLNIIDYAKSLGIDVSKYPLFEKIKEHVVDYTEKGLYSSFNSKDFHRYLDVNASTLDNFDMLFEVFMSIDSTKISIDDAKYLESLFSNDKLSVGIHRTSLFGQSVFESKTANSILTKGLKNMGDLSSGAVNNRPEVNKTVSFSNFLTTLRQISGSYKGSNGAFLLSFPSNMVDSEGDIIGDSFDSIYDIVDGTPTIKPQYILGYYDVTDDGIVKFYSRDEILGKNNVDSSSLDNDDVKFVNKDEVSSNSNIIFNVKQFLKYDLEIKDLLVKCSVSLGELDFRFLGRTVVECSNLLYSSLKDIEVCILKMCELYPKFSGDIDYIKQLFSTYYEELAKNSGNISNLKKFYNTYLSGLSNELIEMVGKNTVGYTDRHVSLSNAKTVNELLHILHQSLLNDHDVYNGFPIVESKTTTMDHSSIFLRGYDTKIAREIFDAFSENIEVGTTDILSLSDNYILLMVRDRGHALMIEIDISDDTAFVKYYIPKICNIEMVNKIKGVRKVDASDKYTNGRFEVETKNIAHEIYSLIESVPGDGDILEPESTGLNLNADKITAGKKLGIDEKNPFKPMSDLTDSRHNITDYIGISKLFQDGVINTDALENRNSGYSGDVVPIKVDVLLDILQNKYDDFVNRRLKLQGGNFNTYRAAFDILRQTIEENNLKDSLTPEMLDRLESISDSYVKDKTKMFVEFNEINMKKMNIKYQKVSSSNGIVYNIPVNYDKKTADILIRKIDLIFKMMPDILRNSTNEIYFNDFRASESVRDEFLYDIPVFSTYTTGGDGNIYFYQDALEKNSVDENIDDYLIEALYHEAAHNLDKFLGNFSESQEWKNARIRDGKSFNWYAAASSKEDFAVTVAAYFMNRLNGEYPNRIKLIEDIFSGKIGSDNSSINQDNNQGNVDDTFINKDNSGPERPFHSEEIVINQDSDGYFGEISLKDGKKILISDLFDIVIDYDKWNKFIKSIMKNKSYDSKYTNEEILFGIFKLYDNGYIIKDDFLGLVKLYDKNDLVEINDLDLIKLFDMYNDFKSENSLLNADDIIIKFINECFYDRKKMTLKIDDKLYSKSKGGVDQHSVANAFSPFSFNFYNKELKIDLINQVVSKFPGMSKKLAVKFLSVIDGLKIFGGTDGVCNYADVCNFVFEYFVGREQEFEQRFGFPMYRDGKLNDAQLLCDMFISISGETLIETVTNGAITANWKNYRFILGFKDDTYQLTNKDYENLCNYCGALEGYKIDLISNYLRNKGIISNNQLLVQDQIANFRGANRSKFLNNLIANDILFKVKSALERGEHISISSWDGKNKLVNSLNLTTKQGLMVNKITGGHIMTICGIEDGHLLVDSWGKIYYVDIYQALADNVPFTIDTIYIDSYGGNVQNLNYDYSDYNGRGVKPLGSKFVFQFFGNKKDTSENVDTIEQDDDSDFDWVETEDFNDELINNENDVLLSVDFIDNLSSHVCQNIEKFIGKDIHSVTVNEYRRYDMVVKTANKILENAPDGYFKDDKARDEFLFGKGDVLRNPEFIKIFKRNNGSLVDSIVEYCNDDINKVREIGFYNIIAAINDFAIEHLKECGLDYDLDADELLIKKIAAETPKFYEGADRVIADMLGSKLESAKNNNKKIESNLIDIVDSLGVKLLNRNVRDKDGNIVHSLKSEKRSVEKVYSNWHNKLVENGFIIKSFQPISGNIYFQRKDGTGKFTLDSNGNLFDVNTNTVVYDNDGDVINLKFDNFVPTDLLRYTIIADENNYVGTVVNSIRMLESKGYKIEKAKLDWPNKENKFYQGVNLTLSKDGQVFELQIHTENSFYAKDDGTHLFYEVKRNDAFRISDDKKVLSQIQRVSNYAQYLVQAQVIVPVNAHKLYAAKDGVESLINQGKPIGDYLLEKVNEQGTSNNTGTDQSGLESVVESDSGDEIIHGDIYVYDEEMPVIEHFDGSLSGVLDRSMEYNFENDSQIDSEYVVEIDGYKVFSKDFVTAIIQMGNHFGDAGINNQELGKKINKMFLEGKTASMILSELDGNERVEFENYLNNTIEGRFLSKITDPNLIKAVSIYTRIGYNNINSALRSGNMDGVVKYTNSLTKEKESISVKELIDSIDEIIELYGGLDSNTVLYRAVGLGAFIEQNEMYRKAFESIQDKTDVNEIYGILRNFVGFKFSDKGYMSTSPGYNTSLAKKPYPIVLEILAPQGTPGAYINQVSKQYNVENEFLLDKGTNLRIVDVKLYDDMGDYNAFDRVVVRCEVLPNDADAKVDQVVDVEKSLPSDMVYDEDSSDLDYYDDSVFFDEDTSDVVESDNKKTIKYKFNPFDETIVRVEETSTKNADTSVEKLDYPERGDNVGSELRVAVSNFKVGNNKIEFTELQQNIRGAHINFDFSNFLMEHNGKAICIITSNQMLLVPLTDEVDGLNYEKIYRELYNDRDYILMGNYSEQNFVNNGDIIIVMDSDNFSNIEVLLPNTVKSTQVDFLKQFNDMIKKITKDNERFEDEPVYFYTFTDDYYEGTNNLDNIIDGISGIVDDDTKYPQDVSLELNDSFFEFLCSLDFYKFGISKDYDRYNSPKNIIFKLANYVCFSNETFISVQQMNQYFGNGILDLELGLKINGFLLGGKTTSDIIPLLNDSEKLLFEEYLENSIEGQFLSKLSAIEIEAISIYTSAGGAYEKINCAVRELGKNGSLDDLPEVVDGVEVRKIAKALDEVVNKFGGLKEDMIIYRGTDLAEFTFQNEVYKQLFLNVDTKNLDEVYSYLRLLTGETLTYSSLVSSSPGYNTSFASKDDMPIVLQIIAPKGTKGAYINMASTLYNQECEYLFSRNTTLEIIEVVNPKMYGAHRKIVVKCIVKNIEKDR